MISPEQWILLGIPVIFLFGSLIHFLYAICHQNVFIGLIAPVNESVWEHTKLGLLPTFLWFISYFLFSSNILDIPSWMVSCLVSILISIITIPLFFYFYTQAFGKESLLIDIFIFSLSTLLGQLLALHLYQYWFSIPISYTTLAFFFLFLLYAFLTVFPPKIPLFKDGSTGTYGIRKRKN